MYRFYTAVGQLQASIRLQNVSIDGYQLHSQTSSFSTWRVSLLQYICLISYRPTHKCVDIVRRWRHQWRSHDRGDKSRGLWRHPHSAAAHPLTSPWRFNNCITIHAVRRIPLLHAVESKLKTQSYDTFQTPNYHALEFLYSSIMVFWDRKKYIPLFFSVDLTYSPNKTISWKSIAMSVYIRQLTVLPIFVRPHQAMCVSRTSLNRYAANTWRSRSNIKVMWSRSLHEKSKLAGHCR